MKRKSFAIIIAFMSLSFSSTVSADTPVKVTPKITNPITSRPVKKAPAMPLVIYQEGHQFFFNNNWIGEIVSLVSDDEVVYTTIIDENGTITFPSSLTGIYTIEITMGDMVYWGEIEL